MYRQGFGARLFEIEVSEETPNINLEMEENARLGIVYATVLDAVSAFPLIGASVTIASNTTLVASRGRTSAFTLPYGEYSLMVKYPGRPILVTNVVVATGTPNYTVYLPGYTPYISGFLYGTGGEIVKEGQIQVLNRTTQNIVKRLNLDGLPFFDINLGLGQPAALRLRPQNYDNDNYDLTLDNPAHKDFVLTPEPAIAIIFLLGLFCLLRKK